MRTMLVVKVDVAKDASRTLLMDSSDVSAGGKCQRISPAMLSITQLSPGSASTTREFSSHLTAIADKSYEVRKYGHS